MSKTVKSIIWDWNGTLLDDMALCVRIVNSLLVNHSDQRLDMRQYRNVFGFPIHHYYEKIGIDFRKESFQVLTDRFISDYSRNVTSCNLHVEVGRILDHYRLREVSQFILTAAHRGSVADLLSHFNISQYFEQIYGLDNHRAETKLELGRDLIKNNDLSLESTVLIGDTIHDFEVAAELGIRCILISNGHQSRERLVTSTQGKVLVLNSINELAREI